MLSHYDCFASIIQNRSSCLGPYGRPDKNSSTAFLYYRLYLLLYSVFNHKRAMAAKCRESHQHSTTLPFPDSESGPAERCWWVEYLMNLT
jgi:hypothetical protein